jgi:hypothetical protein
MFNVCEAVAGGVLNAPGLPIVRPLDLGPHLPVDHEVVGFGIATPDLDHPVASLVCHHFRRLLSLSPLPAFLPATPLQMPISSAVLALFYPLHLFPL